MKNKIEQIIAQKELAKKEIETWSDIKRALLIGNRPSKEKDEKELKIKYGKTYNYMF